MVLSTPGAPPRKKRPWWVRLIRWTLALLLGPPLLYLAAALGLALIPVHTEFQNAGEDGVEVFIVSNGVHVDFLVPATNAHHDWTRELPRRDFRGADERCTGLLFGWGDRGFYLETPTWADLKVSTALRAIFYPSPSVMHVDYVDWRPPAGPSSRRIVLAPGAYHRLCNFIAASFRRDTAGAPVLIPGEGYSDTDNFYEGTGRYHALNTCNLWTNRGLSQAGVRTALWSPLAPGVLWHLPE